MIVELQGLYRHWEHPIGTSEASWLKVKEIGTKVKRLNYVIVAQQKGIARRQLVLQWIASYGAWPDCKYADSHIPHGPVYSWWYTRRLMKNQSMCS